MRMSTEPARLTALITAALTATIGVLTIVGVWSADVGGAVSVALGGWVLVAGEVLRSRVTPTAGLEPGDDAGQSTVGLVLIVVCVVLAVLFVLERV
jgi:hypothetical protein